MRLSLAKEHAKDVVARALERIVVGLEDKSGGRRPKQEEIANDEAWLNYLRGVANSVLEGWVRRRNRKPAEQAEPYEESDSSKEALLTDQAPTPDRHAELEDFRRAFFEAVRPMAPEHLIPVIDAWEQDFWHTDRIPAQRLADRRELRALAQRAYRMLEADTPNRYLASKQADLV